jgi:Ca2+-binding EF-hand superfamily protein
VAEMAKQTGYDEHEVDALFRGADLNGDEMIGFEEFIEMVKYSYITMTVTGSKYDCLQA